MFKDRTPSDSELILGSFFVVCVFVGIGLFGAHQSQRVAIRQGAMGALTGATTNTAPSATQNATSPTGQTQDCLEKLQPPQGSMTGAQEWACKPKCYYKVDMHFAGRLDLSATPDPNSATGRGIILPSFGGSPIPFTCTKQTLQGSLAGASNYFNNIQFQNAAAFNTVAYTTDGIPGAATAGSVTSGGTTGSTYARQPSTPVTTQTNTGANSYTPYGYGQSANPGGYDPWTQSLGTPGATAQPNYGECIGCTREVLSAPGTSAVQGSETYGTGDIVQQYNSKTGMIETYSLQDLQQASQSGSTIGGSGSTNFPSPPPSKPLVPGAIDPEALAYQRGTAPSSINDEALAYGGAPNAPTTGNIYDQAHNQACAQNPSACIGGPSVSTAKPVVTDPSLTYGAEGIEDAYKVSIVKYDDNSAAPGTVGWAYRGSDGSINAGSFNTTNTSGHIGYFTRTSSGPWTFMQTVPTCSDLGIASGAVAWWNGQCTRQ